MTVNRLMMELDMVLCDSSLHGDEEHEGLEDWLGMWANSGHRNALGQGNNYLVLAGWSEHGAFPSFGEARRLQLSLEDEFPRMKFDVWIEFRASGQRMKILDGREPVEESRGCTWSGFRDWRRATSRRGHWNGICR